MAGTVTTYNSDNRDIERDPVVLFFDYLAEVGATKSEEIVLRAMPAGCTYLWAKIQCIQADGGTATSTLNLKHGSTTIFTGSSDNGATLNTIDGGEAGSDGAFLPGADTSAAGNLIADYDMTGTTTTAPKYRIVVCVARTDF